MKVTRHHFNQAHLSLPSPVTLYLRYVFWRLLTEKVQFQEPSSYNYVPRKISLLNRNLSSVEWTGNAYFFLNSIVLGKMMTESDTFTKNVHPDAFSESFDLIRFPCDLLCTPPSLTQPISPLWRAKELVFIIVSWINFLRWRGSFNKTRTLEGQLRRTLMALATFLPSESLHFPSGVFKSQ